MNDYTPSDYSKFIESLKVTKPETDEVYGIRYDADLTRYLCATVGVENLLTKPQDLLKIIVYLAQRCKLAESNAKSPDLAEQVKGFMRAALDVYEDDGFDGWTKRSLRIADEFRRLSEETEVKL